MGIPYAEVIGDPIAHSKSPIIHGFWLAKLGLNYEFRKQRVAPEDLASYFQLRRCDQLWCGSSITIPHKQAVVPLVHDLSYPADTIGAVNAVTRTGGKEPQLIGHNTDAAGFLDTLQGWPGLEKPVRLASVIGTGGGAAAVASVLRDQGFLIFAYSRSKERGAAFLERLGERDADFVQRLESLANVGPEIVADPDRADMVINASPLGMRGFPPLDLSLTGYSPATLFYDLVYDPVETELIRTGRDRGHPVISGIDMLIAQAARAFALFYEEEAPRQHDAELKELLTS